MPINTDNIANHTVWGNISDALGDPLRSLRVRSGLLLREDYQQPWGVQIPTSRELATALGLDLGTQLAAFHLVEAGELLIDHPGADPRLLGPGEIAISFGGQAHRLGAGDPERWVPVEELLSGGARVRPRETPRRSRSTSLVCGVFVLQNSMLNPLLAALPPLLSCSLAGPGELDGLGPVARIMAREIDATAPGGTYVVERLLEVLCAQAIRAHVETSRAHAPGFFSALGDPVISKALALLHSRPGKAWSVKRLAEEVSMSPSRLTARFSGAVGTPVMTYLTRWRMHLACRELSEGDQRLDQLAQELGCESTPAFQRAFKRAVGVAPGAWRRQCRAPRHTDSRGLPRAPG